MECLHNGNCVVKVIGQLLDLHPAPPCDFTTSRQLNSRNPSIEVEWGWDAASGTAFEDAALWR